MLHFFKCSDFQPHYIFVLTVHFTQTDPFQSYVTTALISTELARAQVLPVATAFLISMALEHRPYTLASHLYFYQHKGKCWLELSPGFAGSCVLTSLPPILQIIQDTLAFLLCWPRLLWDLGLMTLEEHLLTLLPLFTQQVTFSIASTDLISVASKVYLLHLCWFQLVAVVSKVMNLYTSLQRFSVWCPGSQDLSVSTCWIPLPLICSKNQKISYYFK